MNRRGFLLGLGAAAVAAPAIVRAASIMPVRAWRTKEQIINDALLAPYGRSPMLEIARIEREIQDIYYKSLFEMIAQQNEILEDMPYARVRHRPLARLPRSGVWRPLQERTAARERGDALQLGERLREDG